VASAAIDPVPNPSPGAPRSLITNPQWCWRTQAKFIDEAGRSLGVRRQTASPSCESQRALSKAARRLGYVNALYGLMRADVLRGLGCSAIIPARMSCCSRS